ncbi:hypothetical protein HBB16_11115 [Pseudonocardia sp. MCCB 268]|nr:hypothetical protein [Pseudonocardia cytotoxica]
MTTKRLPAARAVVGRSEPVRAEMFSSMGGYIAERARDIHDVRDRIVAELRWACSPSVSPISTRPGRARRLRPGARRHRRSAAGRRASRWSPSRAVFDQPPPSSPAPGGSCRGGCKGARTPSRRCRDRGRRHR